MGLSGDFRYYVNKIGKSIRDPIYGLLRILGIDPISMVMWFPYSCLGWVVFHVIDRNLWYKELLIFRYNSTVSCSLFSSVEILIFEFLFLLISGRNRHVISWV